MRAGMRNKELRSFFSAEAFLVKQGKVYAQMQGLIQCPVEKLFQWRTSSFKRGKVYAQMQGLIECPGDKFFQRRPSCHTWKSILCLMNLSVVMKSLNLHGGKVMSDGWKDSIILGFIGCIGCSKFTILHTQENYFEVRSSWFSDNHQRIYDVKFDKNLWPSSEFQNLW